MWNIYTFHAGEWGLYASSFLYRYAYYTFTLDEVVHSIRARESKVPFFVEWGEEHGH